MRALLSLLLVLAAACADDREVPARLAAGADQEAQAVVERFFSFYVAADAEQAVELLCERDAASRGQAAAFIRSSQAPGSRFRVQAFDVRKVEPSWDGTEPLFWVTVAFPRNTTEGEMVHAYRVRAKDGCIERFLGGPSRPPAQQPVDPKPAPAELPPPAPPETAPVGTGDDVIEL
jgi:hypothetical protein